MKHYEQQILDLTEDARNELAYQCIGTLFSIALSGADTDTSIGTLLIGAKIGIGSDRPLNRGERNFSKYLATVLVKSHAEETLTSHIESLERNELMYEIARQISACGLKSAMAFFRYILCWALADGVIEPEVEEHLENIFGLFFVLDFADSGLESVPTPRVQLKGLEADIAIFLKENPNVCFFRDIKSHFPGVSERELKQALGRLCAKGVLTHIDTAVGDMYELENADSLEVNRRSSSPAPAPKKQAEKKEDEEKKKREEKQKREAAEKKYREDRQAYEKECAEVEARRARYVGSETAVIEKKYQAERKKLSEAHEAKCKSNQRTADSKRAKLKQLEAELGEAGLFAFGKKKQLRAEIEAQQKTIQSLAAEKAQLDASYESAKKKNEAEEKAKIAKLPDAARERFSMPREPQKPQQETETPKKQLTALGRENERLKDAIAAGMQDGRIYTVADIIREIPECRSLGSQRISPLMNAMCQADDGRLLKTVEKRISYYMLA